MEIGISLAQLPTCVCVNSFRKNRLQKKNENNESGQLTHLNVIRIIVDRSICSEGKRMPNIHILLSFGSRINMSRLSWHDAKRPCRKMPLTELAGHNIKVFNCVFVLTGQFGSGKSLRVRRTAEKILAQIVQISCTQNQIEICVCTHLMSPCRAHIEKGLRISLTANHHLPPFIEYSYRILVLFMDKLVDPSPCTNKLWGIAQFCNVGDGDRWRRY